VTQQANDGVSVTANSCILAARSPCFRKLLKGKYDQGVVLPIVISLDYSGQVLQSIVEYIYTDTPKEFSSDHEDGTDILSIQSAISEITALADAAIDFGLAELYERIVQIVTPKIRRYPALYLETVVHDLQSCNSSDLLLHIKELALKCIRKDFTQVIASNELLILSFPALKVILSDDKLDASYLALSHLVQHWTKM
jgi:hypothetical protein